jgi:hypothetical protein
MNLNYNVLGFGKLTKPGKDVREAGGPPSVSSATAQTSWLMSLLLALFLVTGGSLFAQTPANYSFAASSGTYTPITVADGATAVPTAFADDVNQNLTGLPAFTVNGVSYTNYQMNSNGRVSLYTTTAPTSTTTYTPLSSSITNAAVVIAPLGADLYPSSVATSNWYYQVIGSEIVFQWENVSRYYSTTASNDTLNFQIRLNTATGSISFVYGTFTLGTNPTSSPQVGFRTTTTYSTDVNNLYLNITGSPTTCDWSNAVTGFSNSSTLYLNNANPTVKPASGLTFTWSKQTAPAPVRVFTAPTAITTSSATISWTAPAGATQYNVQYRPVGSCSWTNWSGNPVTTNSVTLTGLAEFTSYEVRVQASNGTATSIYSHIPGATGTNDGYSAAGTFKTLAACAAPTALTTNSVTSNSANLAWTASSSAPSGGYQYEIRTSGAAGSGTTGLATSGNIGAGVVTASATGLSPQTAYSAYVRSNCGAGVFSNWTAAANFTTPCVNSALPITEGFNVAATTSASPSCWSQQNVSGTLAIYQTITSPGPSGTSPVAPLYEGSGMVFYNSYSNSTSTRLVSPPITTTGVTSVDVKFQWYYSSNGGATLYLTEGVTVQWSADGITWNDFTNNFVRRYGATTGWAPVLMTLPAGAGNLPKLYVGFKLTGNGGYDTYMDAVAITATPTCIAPTGLASSAVTNNSASISWAASTTAPANGYEYYYATTNTAPTAATAPSGSVGAGVLTATLSGLTSNTNYYFWVRSVCSGTDTSAWSLTSGTFKTQCDPTTSFSENFDGVTAPALPSCWSSIMRGANVAGNVPTVGTATTNFSSPNGVQIYNSGTTSVDDLILVSPPVSNLGTGTYELRFYAKNSVDTQDIQVGTLNNNTSTAVFTPLQTVDINTTWTEYTVSFAGYTGTDTFIGIRRLSTSTFTYVYLDNMVWEPIPTCFKPTAVTVSNTTSTSATIGWTAPTQGTPASYEYEVRTSGAAGSGTTGLFTSGTVNAPTASVAISGLTPETQYTVYVRTFCGGTDNSIWTNATNLFTGACLPTGTVTSYWISNFTTTGAAANVNNTTTASAGGYGNYYNSQSISTYVGQTITASILTGNTSSTHHFYIWADFNNDFDFDDAGETIVAQTASYTNTFSGSFTIPAGVAVGTYRLRIANVEAGTTTPCGPNLYGEYEDYKLIIVTPPPAVISFTPSPVCSADLATTVVTLTGTNFTGATSVTLNGTSTPFTVVNDTTINVNLTAGSTAGNFAVTTPNGTGTSSTPFAITASPTVAAITNGDATLCVGGPTVDMNDATPAGTWSSTNTAVATVDNNGIVTAVSAGTATIKYTVENLGCSSSQSTSVTVNAPVVSSNPGAQTVVTGNTATFSVTASGSILSYQWQVSTDGETFANITNDANYSGATTNTLTITATPDTFNGNFYQVVITPAAPCDVLVSGMAVLNVGNTGIATDPANVSLCSTGNGTATFTVVASGEVDSYSWEEDQGLGFAPITDGTFNGVTYSGATTSVLTVSGLSVANTGWAYHAFVQGPANSATSNTATVTINSGVTVDTAPSAQTVCSTGGSSTFTVGASGTVAGYQWQYSTDNVNFTNVVNGTPVGATYSGSNTASLVVATTAATPAAGTYYYHAVVSGNSPCAAVTSASAQLIINNPVVSSQPVAATVLAGNTATFTVSTAAPSPTYQWQYATAVGGPYTNVTDATPAGVTYSGQNTASLSVNVSSAAAASTARYYRAVVTSGSCSVNSNGAQLTINNYCVPSASLTTSYFDAFATTGGVTNITNTASGFSTGGYGNFTNLNVTQMQGEVVNFTTTLVGTTVGVAIWVDWNHNGAFETTERVANTTGYVSTFAGSFAVPVTATPGPTRMRIMMDFNNNNPTNPCITTTGRRESEDYTFTVTVPPACSGTPVAGTASASSTSICVSGTTTLSLTGYPTGVTGISYQWYNGSTPISGATATTYTTPTITTPQSYFVRVTCAASGLSSDSNTVNITVNNPTVDSTTPGSRCGVGTVALSATGSAGTVLNWYAAATGGVPLYTGSTFTTPSISATTNYYVEANVGGATGSIGAVSPAVGAYSTSFTGSYEIFNVTAPVTINTVDLYPTAAGTVIAELLNSAGTVLQTSATFTVTAAQANSTTSVVGTPVVMPINFAIPVGTGYRLNLKSASTATLTRNSAGATATYGPVLNAITITGNSNATTGYFYNFYNWSVSTGCASPRVAVTATVTTPPVLTISSNSASICAGSSVPTPVTITSNVSDFDTYVWSPSTGVSGNANSGYTFNPSATTTYTLTASNAAGCANTATYTVTVNPLPAAIAFTPAAPAMCSNGTPVQINAFSGTVSGINGGCLEASEGQYPSATYTPSTCNGSTVNSITTAAYAGEYSMVNVSANTRYTFTSTGSGDYVTIGDSAGNVILASGPSPVSWISTSTTQVRFYTHTDNACGEQAVSRTRSVICQPLNTVVFSPTAGLFTDAAGTVAYSGQNVISVYAKPASTSTYTATATSAAGCTTSAQVTVTVTQATTWYADADGDGYGNNTSPTVQACVQPTGYAANNTDCNDAVAAINPGHAEVLYNGIDDNCNGQMDENAQIVSQVQASQCGTTVASMASSIGAVLIQNATAYRFRVRNTETNVVQTIVRTQGWFQLNMLATYDYATTYAIDIEVQRNGVWLGYYGPVCNVSSPAVVSSNGGGAQVVPTQCGVTLAAIYSTISTNPLTGVTGYRFRVTNMTNPSAPNQVQILDRGGSQWFTLPMLATYTYGTQYMIEVSVKTTGTYGPYGSPCVVSSPAVPMLTNCGMVVANTHTNVSTQSLNRVTSYRYELTNMTATPNVVTTIDLPRQYFMFTDFPGFQPGATYAVRIAVMSSGVYSLYGDACTITAPGTAKPTQASEAPGKAIPFAATAYPNPFAESFGINVKTSAEGEIAMKVYDMTGRLLETRNVPVSEMETVQIGNRYPAGVYNVIVSQGENVRTLRVIKR